MTNNENVANIPDCGNTFYHSGCMLLLQTGIVAQEPDVEYQCSDSPIVSLKMLQFPPFYLAYSQHDIFWHARELVGISISNPSQYVEHRSPSKSSMKIDSKIMTRDSANWVNQLQPLFIAGTVFGNSVATPIIRDVLNRSLSHENTAQDDLQDDDYCSEKILLLKHLAKIERETGWKTSDRAAELRMLWGFA